MANVIPLHPRPSSVGLFIRLGHTGHRKLETLLAAGRISIDRAVVDAAHLVEQRDLLDALRKSGTELILDTKAAELSTPGGYSTKARMLPWAHANRHHGPSDFNGEELNSFARRIAIFAVENRVDAVLAPTRPLNGPRDQWLDVDTKSCEVLRRTLDKEGGQAIAVDYPLLITYEAMRDEAERRVFVNALKDLPFENLWLRISGFGSSATAVGTRRYINGADDFHSLEKPIIADGIGGLVGLATIALGAVGGLSHGVAEKERFNAKDWSKPRTGDGGGTRKRIYLRDIDTYLYVEETQKLFESRGAKSLLGCNDTGCCPHGIEDMLGAPKTHFLIQRTKQFGELNSVPETRRGDHFLRRQLGPAGSAARKVERLNFKDTKLADKLRTQSRRLDEMRQVLEDLHETRGIKSWAMAPKKRNANIRPASIGRP